MNPMDALLDMLEWEAVPPPAEPDPDIPYATHTGVLSFDGVELRVYQLNDGRRLLDGEDMQKFFNPEFSTVTS